MNWNLNFVATVHNLPTLPAVQVLANSLGASLLCFALPTVSDTQLQRRLMFAFLVRDACTF